MIILGGPIDLVGWYFLFYFSMVICLYEYKVFDKWSTPVGGTPEDSVKFYKTGCGS